MGPPRELITHLKAEFRIDYFIETGTFYGKTSAWASNEFDTVKTVELSDELYSNVQEEYGHIGNIEFIKGKSQEKLSNIIQKLDSSAIFWLDAHYSGGGTAGENYECPLLEEIETIGKSNVNEYIFIDDARLFCSPPPRPHSAEDWPTISDVMLKLNKELGDRYYITITEDVIIAVPQSAKNVVLNYAQDVVTKESNKSDIERGIPLVIQGIIDKLNTQRNREILKKIGLYPVASKVYHRISKI
jgi:hypothetical protein